MFSDMPAVPGQLYLVSADFYATPSQPAPLAQATASIRAALSIQAISMTSSMHNNREKPPRMSLGFTKVTLMPAAFSPHSAAYITG